MFLQKPAQQEYESLPSSDGSSSPDSIEERYPKVPTRRPWSKFTKVGGLVCAIIFCVAGTFALGYTSGYQQGTKLPPAETGIQAPGNCTEPYFRREWRSLSNPEKRDYLDAVQCFIDSPSVLGMNGSLYNDFSRVHNLIANNIAKLPNRFWDWSLDWEDPGSSPIFDSQLGFGGDGDPNAPKYQSAHCVTDSPFKNLTPQWYGSKYEPHCLTRFFDEDWFGHYMNPAALEKVMAATTYEDFFLALEMGPHDIIPTGIRGDFTSFTAPNDPIFYLHHSQLDRVWWLWQLRDKTDRVKSYGGIADSSGRNVTLSDILPLAGLEKDIAVADVMDTEGGEMCYRYMYT
ncbi:hypothetical protein FQN50_005323 [Emmonsiellopsis sp. PD_5]|nr:hypothetical protein FQN50_005323 [Emmonsiellopsis sp. PD_5]